MGETSRRIRFDGTFSFGHLLTVGTLAAGMLIWGLRLEGRVDSQAIVIAAQRDATAQKVLALDQRMSWQAEVTREALSRIETGMQRIETKLDTKADKRP